MNGSNGRNTPVGKVVQIFAGGLIYAVRSADPEIALIVGESARRIVVKEPIPFRVVGHAATADVESGDSGYSATEPKASTEVAGYGGDGERHLLLPRVAGRFARGEFEKAQDCTKPQDTRWIAVYGERVVAGAGQWRGFPAKGERLNLAIAETQGQCFVGGDNKTLIVLADG